MAKEYTTTFQFQGPPKFNQIGIFVSEKYHLATLVRNRSSIKVKRSLIIGGTLS
jgi:hypothetical protein